MNRITSYVCSAVYYDRDLREKVIYLLENDYKVLADPQGLELDKILTHSYKARIMDRTRHYLVFLPAFVALIFGFEALGLVALLITTIILIIYRVNLEVGILRNGFAYPSKPMNVVPSSTYVNNLIHKRQPQICNNVIYYSGYSPFIGSGNVLNGWSFSINIDKPAEGKINTVPFDVAEIYHQIAKAVQSLNISNLVISEKLIINGRSIRKNQRLLPNSMGHPITQLSDSEIKAFMNIYNKNARYYQHIQVSDWDDELVFSVFLKFHKTKKHLFVECSYSVLTPVKEEYKLISSISPNLSFSDYINIFTQSLFLSFFASIQSVFFVFGNIISGIEKLIFGKSGIQRKLYNQVKRNPDFDYGVSLSIRELIASPVYPQYFHVLDKDMYLKTIEKTILSSITDFLEAKDIDVSELKERETKILNEGIIISGGNLTANNLNVGKTTTINKITTAIKSSVKTSYSD